MHDTSGPTRVNTKWQHGLSRRANGCASEAVLPVRATTCSHYLTIERTFRFTTPTHLEHTYKHFGHRHTVCFPRKCQHHVMPPCSNPETGAFGHILRNNHSPEVVWLGWCSRMSVCVFMFKGVCLWFVSRQRQRQTKQDIEREGRERSDRDMGVR